MNDRGCSPVLVTPESSVIHAVGGEVQGQRRVSFLVHTTEWATGGSASTPTLSLTEGTTHPPQTVTMI